MNEIHNSRRRHAVPFYDEKKICPINHQSLRRDVDAKHSREKITSPDRNAKVILFSKSAES